MDNPGFQDAFQEDSKPAAGAKSTADLNQVELADMTASPATDGVKQSNGGSPNQGEDNADTFVLQKKAFNPEDESIFARSTMRVQASLKKFYKEKEFIIKTIIGLILLLAYLCYVAYAMHYKFGDEGSYRLLVGTIIGVLFLLFHLLSDHFAFIWDRWDNFLSNNKFTSVRRTIRYALYVTSLIATVTLTITLVALEEPRNLLSLAGLAGFVVLCFLTSHNPAMIQWHPVFWGFSMQFYFAVLILKTGPGFDAFDWLGDRVTEFLAYSDAGAKFLFGDVVDLELDGGGFITIKNAFLIHTIAFQVLPVVTFFGTIISILYYLGVMQVVVKFLGRILSFCLGTTPAESLNAAGNIFVSMTEGPLLIRPYIAKMTSSELHAVMTGGFATIAGSVLGIYISIGVSANHLLSASVMSAPAALAISKLTYPEVEVPIIDENEYDMVEETKEHNIVEAACNGAILSGKIIASSMVNIIAFLSLLKCANATLTWFGDRAGVDDLTFEFLCSYVLYPVALFMGTEPEDCRLIAELVGVKTFTNEFIAYQRLSVILQNRKDLEEYKGHWYWDGDDIILNDTNTRLKDGVISERSGVIATYALCGFSSFDAMGIVLASLGALAPNRRTDLSKIVFRAMMAGNLACFTTACIAGLFHD